MNTRHHNRHCKRRNQWVSGYDAVIPIPSILGIDLYPKSSQIWLIKLLSLIGTIRTKHMKQVSDTALPHFPLLSTNFGVTWALQNPWASQNPGAPGARAYLTDPEEKLFHDLGRWGWHQNPGPIFLEFPTSSMPNLLELRFLAGSSSMNNSYRQRNRPQNQEKNIQKKQNPGKSARKKNINPQQ